MSLQNASTIAPPLRPLQNYLMILIVFLGMGWPNGVDLLKLILASSPDVWEEAMKTGHGGAHNAVLDTWTIERGLNCQALCSR